MPGIDSSSSARLDYSLPSRLEEIAALANAVEVFLAADPQLAFQTNLCLEELLTNTIVHGLHGEPGHVIRVSLKRVERGLEVTLTDDAPPFDPFCEAAPPDQDALYFRTLTNLACELAARAARPEYAECFSGGRRLLAIDSSFSGTRAGWVVAGNVGQWLPCPLRGAPAVALQALMAER